jgi:hypothetical protein
MVAKEKQISLARNQGGLPKRPFLLYRRRNKKCLMAWLSVRRNGNCLDLQGRLQLPGIQGRRKCRSKLISVSWRMQFSWKEVKRR